MSLPKGLANGRASTELVVDTRALPYDIQDETQQRNAAHT